MVAPVIQRQGGLSPKPPLFDYDSWGLDENGGIYHELYGEWWDGKIGYTRLDIELSAFIRGLTPEEGGMGKYEHLRECIDLLWNTGGKNVVEWNPWLEKMLEESCEHNFLAVAGCSSSSKSFGGAIIAIVNFIADPENTLVLVTSTSIGAAKRRIWKSVMQLWNKLPDKYKRLGKIKPSLNMIHYQPQDGSVAHDAASICLVAAEQKQEASAVQKLVGLKNERVILIADELCELSPAVLHASDNLISNPWFQMIAMSNPKDREDPFGLMCEPVEGWATLDESMMEWDTKYGKAIRFDVLQSPNYLEQEVIYKYMLTYEKIEKFRQQHGENSSRFYRFYRGFFPVQGTEDTIYTDTDFNAYMQESVKWKKEPTKIAGLDLSFSSGGDKTSLCICLFGGTAGDDGVGACARGGADDELKAQPGSRKRERGDEPGGELQEDRLACIRRSQRGGCDIVLPDTANCPDYRKGNLGWSGCDELDGVAPWDKLRGKHGSWSGLFPGQCIPGGWMSTLKYVNADLRQESA